MTSKTRITALPDVPTMVEAHVNNYDTFRWFALLASAGTPKQTIDEIYGGLAVQDPTVREHSGVDLYRLDRAS